MMNLLLIRHGETPSNLKKIYAGKNAEGLTERGIAQAKEVSEELKNYKIYALYSSPVQRAVQTAKIIGETVGVDFSVEDAFREIELGLWEGLSEEEVARLYPEEWRIWQDSPAKLKLPGRETLKELLDRVLAGVRKVQQVAKQHTVVMVTHVAVIRVLLLWHAEKNLNLYKTIYIPNAEIFEIRIDNR